MRYGRVKAKQKRPVTVLDPCGSILLIISLFRNMFQFCIQKKIHSSIAYNHVVERGYIGDFLEEAARPDPCVGHQVIHCKKIHHNIST
jgi:hypothetical protein